MSSKNDKVCSACNGSDGSNPVAKYIGIIVLGVCLVVALVFYAVMGTWRRRGRSFYKYVPSK